MTDPASGPMRPTSGPGRVLNVTPESAGWEYLSFAVHELTPAVGHAETADGRETAIVPLSGAGRVRAGDQVFELSRTSVFEQKPHIVYVPPGVEIEIETDGAFTCSVGSAPSLGAPMPEEPMKSLRPSAKVMSRPLPRHFGSQSGSLLW